MLDDTYGKVIMYRSPESLEATPIFYKKSAFDLLFSQHFWLSETPDVPSKSWGAQFNRVCSYVILTEKATKKDFVVFNTHLSHVSDEARINGIGVVLDKISEFGSLPSVIMGDFNAQEGSVTYNNVTENFLDAKHATENTSDSHTYNGWNNPEKFVRIDYFMISQKGIKVNSYNVLSGMRNGDYTSDHCPIVMEIILEK